MSSSVKRRIGNTVAVVLLIGWAAVMLHMSFFRAANLIPNPDKPMSVKPKKGEYRGATPWDIERLIGGDSVESAIEMSGPSS